MRRIAVLAGLWLSSSVAAQDATTAADAAERGAADPTLTSTARSTAPAITVAFTTEEQTARAQIGSSMGSLSRWGLTFSSPIAGAGKRTTLATGEGLASGASAEFLVRYITDPSNPDFTQEEFREICNRYVRNERRADVASSHTCVRSDLNAEGKHVLDVRAFRSAWTFGGSVKAGRTSFAFAEPVGFTDQTAAHDGWSASASVGRFQGGTLASLLYFVGASYRHENAYVGHDESNVCTPIENSSSSVCREIAIGAPRRRQSDLFQLEARSFPLSTVGLAPRVTYEGNTREWSVEVPMYLRQDTGPFSGGVSLGWDSETDKFQISLFVGALPALFE